MPLADDTLPLLPVADALGQLAGLGGGRLLSAAEAGCFCGTADGLGASGDSPTHTPRAPRIRGPSDGRRKAEPGPTDRLADIRSWQT